MRERLLQIQRREGLTDAQVAERLGIARSTWTEVRNDRLPMSDRVQLAAVRAFPELLGTLVQSVTLTPSEVV